MIGFHLQSAIDMVIFIISHILCLIAMSTWNYVHTYNNMVMINSPLTCPLNASTSSKLLLLSMAYTIRKPSPVLIYWSLIALWGKLKILNHNLQYYSIMHNISKHNDTVGMCVYVYLPIFFLTCSIQYVLHKKHGVILLTH